MKNYLEGITEEELKNLGITNIGIMQEKSWEPRMIITKNGEEIIINGDDEITKYVNDNIINIFKLKKLREYVNIKYFTNDESYQPYVDLVYDEENVEAKLFKQEINIINPNISEIQDLVISKIIELSNKNNYDDIIKKLSLVDILKDFDTSDDKHALIRRVISKIMMASNYVATHGRYGIAHNLLISEKNKMKYELSDKLGLLNIIINNDIDDIYIYRKNDVDQPGIIVASCDDKYEMVVLGNQPERQFVVVKLT